MAGLTIGIIILALLALVVVFFIGLGIYSKMYYRKVEQGTAIIVANRKRVKVSFNGAWVKPIYDKVEYMDISVKAFVVDRRGSGEGGLICKDDVRADIAVTFYVRVNATEEDVKAVAQLVGCDRASRHETIENLFGAKFSEALKTVGKQMEFEELFTEREALRTRILGAIGQDLNGYSLDDVAIDYLEQTPLEHLDDDNIQDSRGIRKIVDLTSDQKIARNERDRNREKVIKAQDVEAREKILELERDQAEAEAQQEREIREIQAQQKAAAEQIEAEQMELSERARIAAEAQIGVANENKERDLTIARKAKEQTERVEEERVSRAQELEREERERQVGMKSVEKIKSIEEEKVKIQEVIRERVALERTVAEEEEKIKDVRRVAEANRERQVQVIEAEREAEQNRVSMVEQARAKQDAAEKLYEEAVKMAEAEKYKVETAATAERTRLEQLAEAELIRAQKQAEGDKAMADGIRAKNAADGLAQATVREAHAKVVKTEGENEAFANTERARAEAFAIQAKGEAEAKAIHAKGNAEASASTERYKADAYGTTAKGEAEAAAARAKYDADAEGTRKTGAAEADAINAKADAMKNFDGPGREHEEFKLELFKAERIETASIHMQEAIARAQAQVLGEAMKTAKIELVGGGGDFLDTFFKSISLAKAVDGFVETSDVGKSLISGEGNLLEQVKGLMAKEGLTTEDVKNMTVSAVLAKMALKGDDSGKEAKALKDRIDKLGLDDLMALWLAKK